MTPYFSERDIEIPLLLHFVDSHPEISTVLDVGCYGSKYLKDLKDRGKIVDGVDIKPGTVEREYLRNYFVGNTVTYPLGKYDLVICLSTIEHAGIEYKVENWEKEQFLLFRKVIECSKKFAYITFPYGLPYLYEGFFANVTRRRLEDFLEAIPSGSTIQKEFFFNDSPQSGHGWIKISQEEADKIPYVASKGVRCVCILRVSLV